MVHQKECRRKSVRFIILIHGPEDIHGQDGVANVYMEVTPILADYVNWKSRLDDEDPIDMGHHHMPFRPCPASAQSWTHYGPLVGERGLWVGIDNFHHYSPGAAARAGGWLKLARNQVESISRQYERWLTELIESRAP